MVMSHSYRHYRQVKIINNGRHSSPQVDGFEEIVCDGKRQVYRWNNPTELLQEDDSDFWGESLIDSDNNWFYTHESAPGIRYLNPHEVIIKNLTYPQKNRQHQIAKLSQIKTSILTGINKMKKLAKRIPLALNAAWKELSNEA